MSDAVLALLRRRVEALRAEELDRARGRLGALSRDERRQVERITAQVVEALVPVRAAELTEDDAAALRYLFALEDAV